MTTETKWQRFGKVTRCRYCGAQVVWDKLNEHFADNGHAEQQHKCERGREFISNRAAKYQQHLRGQR